MRLLFVLGCMALLGACAPAPPRPLPLEGPESFQLEGRLSLRQGQTLDHVGVNWRHETDRDEILVSGPLGQGLAELSRDATGARLVMADRQSFAAADWEGLGERAFGVRLPLSNLPRWVLGVVPAPTLDAVGRPRTARVDGWSIDYLEYADGLPVLIEFRRDDIEVRLKIDQWLR
jgi:outer membrane lipoprotein LolB